MLLAAILACGGGGQDTGGGTTSATTPVGPAWSVLAEPVEGGVLLSAWSDGDLLRIAGGNLSDGGGLLARVEGDALCVEQGVTEEPLWWIHGPREGEFYAVGQRGTILHEADGVRQREDVPTEATLYGVWADEDGTVWAVGGVPGTGDSGEIWRRVDGAWSLVAGGLPGAVFKVWNGWFVGEESAWWWDGEQLVERPTGQRLLTVRGRSDDDVWAVGGLTSAVVLHWDGAAWSEVDHTGLGQPLNGVWTAPGEPVAIAGNFGTVALDWGDGWEMPDWPPTAEHLHAVWKHGDRFYAVGGNLMSGGTYGTVLAYAQDPAPLAVEACP